MVFDMCSVRSNSRSLSISLFASVWFCVFFSRIKKCGFVSSCFLFLFFLDKRIWVDLIVFFEDKKMRVWLILCFLRIKNVGLLDFVFFCLILCFLRIKMWVCLILGLVYSNGLSTVRHRRSILVLFASKDVRRKMRVGFIFNQLEMWRKVLLLRRMLVLKKILVFWGRKLRDWREKFRGLVRFWRNKLRS